MKAAVLISLLVLPYMVSLAPADKKDKPASHDVTIQGMKFNPADLQIAAGDSVNWINKDDRDHTVTAKEFKSGNLGKGDSFEQTFPKPGKFTYACSYHPRMKGVVTVLDAPK